MSSVHGPLWDRDEAYRQSVIRKALLLGFSATEHDTTQVLLPRTTWTFTIDGKVYGQYTSLYSAAFDFLRVSKLEYLAGVFRG